MGSNSSSDAHVRFLQLNSYLGALPEGVLHTLVAGALRRSYGRGQAVFLRDQPGDSAVVVLSGQLKVSNTTADGREIGLNFTGLGDIVGEIALLDGGKRTADVIALEPSEVLVIERRVLVPILMQHPDAMLEIMAALCEKLRISTAMIEDSAHEMEVRLAKGLLRLAQQHGLKRGDRIRIELKISQTELGNYVGLSRANVNRQLSLLRNSGLIEQDGATIVIVDHGKLEQLAAMSGRDED